MFKGILSDVAPATIDTGNLTVLLTANTQESAVDVNYFFCIEPSLQVNSTAGETVVFLGNNANVLATVTQPNDATYTPPLQSGNPDRLVAFLFSSPTATAVGANFTVIIGSTKIAVWFLPNYSVSSMLVVNNNTTVIEGVWFDQSWSGVSSISQLDTQSSFIANAMTLQGALTFGEMVSNFLMLGSTTNPMATATPYPPTDSAVGINRYFYSSETTVPPASFVNNWSWSGGGVTSLGLAVRLSP
jgi:hypothetical protein